MKPIISFVSGLSLASAAIIPPSIPTRAVHPSPLFARGTTSAPASITSCSLVEAAAVTLPGVTLAASSQCSCNGGQIAGASRSVGTDGSTSWECATDMTPTPISTEEPAPTWTMRVQVGSSKFMIGDYNQDNFLPFLSSFCDPTGCTASDPQDFKFNWTEQPLGADEVATGSVTLTGNANNDESIIQGMLKSIDTTLLKSSQCVNRWTTFAEGKRKRESGPSPKWITLDLPQCQIVDYVQATLYSSSDNSEGFQQAQMTFGGASQNPSALLCTEIIGDINDALTILGLPGYVTGAVTVAQAVCL